MTARKGVTAAKPQTEKIIANLEVELFGAYWTEGLPDEVPEPMFGAHGRT